MRVWPIRRQETGLAQSRLYLTRWYSLGRRPPSFAEAFAVAARQGWEAGLNKRGAVWPLV